MSSLPIRVKQTLRAFTAAAAAVKISSFLCGFSLTPGTYNLALLLMRIMIGARLLAASFRYRFCAKHHQAPTFLTNCTRRARFYGILTVRIART